MSWNHPVRARGGRRERTWRGRAPSGRGGAARARAPTERARGAPERCSRQGLNLALPARSFSAQLSPTAAGDRCPQRAQPAATPTARRLLKEAAPTGQRRGREGVGGWTGGASATAWPPAPGTRPSVKSAVMSVAFSARLFTFKAKVWKHLAQRSNIQPAPAVFLEVTADK